ncbi:ATP-binding protein [Thermodesulfobacterium hydrogeniphilum]|nr:ATP-binding protein [Thermodesulfobacterium hydrogeniphilum]
MGLACVERIIREHHGKIEVKSEVGKGTEFIIKLPLRYEA